MVQLIAFLIDLDKWRPENLFGSPVLERTPAALTLIYIVGVGILIGFLFISLAENIRRPRFIFELRLDPRVIRRTSQAIANRSLSAWFVVFIALAVTVFGFQVYWTYFADDSNEQFQALSYKDLRNRRTSAASLRGWMLDRSGELGSAIAYYKLQPDGDIVRAYSLEKEMAHLLGSERGTPGLERTLFREKNDAMPETWDVLTKIKRPQEVQGDVRLTIDGKLQAYLAQLLAGRSGAIVVLDPQTGDVLGMYSNPSYDLTQAQQLDEYLKLEGNKREKPLLNRATREFYVPGSTFKTFTMISAFRAGKQSAIFSSYADGFRPVRGSRPIIDDTQKLMPDGSVSGACDGGCQEKNIMFAYKVSSNQYFAQLAIFLGRERLDETAEQVGIAGVETPDEALLPRFFPNIWNTSDQSISNALAPAQSSIVTGKGISLYDLGLEGMGQGYAGPLIVTS